jgi:hypothetical protein
MSSLIKTTMNSPGHWEVMISYTQRDGESVVLASELYHAFRELGLSVWLDIKMAKLNSAAMEEGVKNCKCVIAILSGADASDPNAYFNRTFCVNELKWARSAGIPIQPICAADDKKNIGSFLGQASSKGIHNLGDTDIVHLDRSRIAYWNVAFKEVLSAVQEHVANSAASSSGRSTGETKPDLSPMPQPVMQQQQQEVEKTLKITIPRGVKAGNTITVNLPDGRSLKVKVPNGMRAGNTLTVKCK